MNHEAVHITLPKSSKKEVITMKNGKEIKTEKINEDADGTDRMIYKDQGNTFTHPFSCYLDFESTLHNCQGNRNFEDKTQRYQRHEINSCGLKYNCQHSQNNEPIEIINDGNPEEVIKQTIEKLEEYAMKSYKISNKMKYLTQCQV